LVSRTAYLNSIEDLTLPYRFSIERDIMEWQCEHPKYPLRYFDKEYYRHPCGLIWANNLDNSEYGFATVSLPPLLMYGLKRIYDNQLYFQRCKLCNNLFLAKTANIPTYCGEDCKREGVRLNKQKFDEKAKTIDYERQHKNAYMYWYNKVKKLQKEAADPDRLTAVEVALEKFKVENMERKTAVKDGRMQVGNIIRKYRKDKNMTQEEMAKRLGVTAPAVNKWENGNSLPDISLLSPIGRLLNISIDTLLSHERELSNVEANRLVEEAHDRLKTESFDDVFQWMKQCFAEYPNCHFLILWMARIFDSHLSMSEVADREHYDDYILDCYTRVLESDNEAMRNAAAEALYVFHINKEDYKKAEEYLAYYSQENPERKRRQALIYSKTGRQEEAYKMYEELLYAGYQSLSTTFHNIYILALEDSDFDKAHMLIEKIQNLASLFEFGEYHQISSALELATLEKDEPKTLQIMERMLTNFESIYEFTKSPLYAHMDFKAPSEDYITEIRDNLLEGFRDEETYVYLKGNQRWKDLVGL